MILRIFFSYRGYELATNISKSIQENIASSFSLQDKYIVSFYNYDFLDGRIVEENKEFRSDLEASQTANIFVLIASSDYFIDEEDPLIYTNTAKEFDIFYGEDIKHDQEIFCGNKVTYKALFFLCPHRGNECIMNDHVKKKNGEPKLKMPKSWKYPKDKKHKEEGFRYLGVPPINRATPYIVGASTELKKVCDEMYLKLEEISENHTYVTGPKALEHSYNNGFRGTGFNTLFKKRFDHSIHDQLNFRDVIFCPRMIEFSPGNINFIPITCEGNLKKTNNIFNKYCSYIEKLYKEKAKRIFYLVPEKHPYDKSEMDDFLKNKRKRGYIIFLGEKENNKVNLFEKYVLDKKKENEKEPIEFHYFSDLILGDGRFDKEEYEAVELYVELLNKEQN